MFQAADPLVSAVEVGDWMALRCSACRGNVFLMTFASFARTHRSPGRMMCPTAAVELRDGRLPNARHRSETDND